MRRHASNFPSSFLYLFALYILQEKAPSRFFRDSILFFLSIQFIASQLFGIVCVLFQRKIYYCKELNENLYYIYIVSFLCFFLYYGELSDAIWFQKLERCHSILQNLTAGLSEKEVHDTLNNVVCKDKTHEEVSLGLLVVILTDSQNAAKSYRDLTLITRDGLAIVLLHLNQLVLEKYLRLNDVTRSQLLWLLREMIRTSVTNVDNLCLSLLRHAAGGDISPRNLFLVDALLDIFQENRAWLDKFPFLVASIVYTYLRLIEDHNAPHLAGLRQKEVTFTVSLIRERMADCLAIGR